MWIWPIGNEHWDLPRIQDTPLQVAIEYGDRTPYTNPWSQTMQSGAWQNLDGILSTTGCSHVLHGPLKRIREWPKVVRRSAVALNQISGLVIYPNIFKLSGHSGENVMINHDQTFLCFGRFADSDWRTSCCWFFLRLLHGHVPVV